jgi:hypothetical protein
VARIFENPTRTPPAPISSSGIPTPSSGEIDTLVDENQLTNFGPDPITGYGGSSTSNDNQIAILSTIDYSTTINSSSSLASTDISQNSTYSYTITTNNYYCAPEEESSIDQGSTEQIDNANPAQSASMNLLFNSSGYFKKGGRRQIEKIENFTASDGNLIRLSSKVFKGIGEITFASASSRKERKDIAKTSIDLIYEQSSGRLYFNGNGDIKGFGSNGGLLAIFETAPQLSADLFLLS